MGLSYTMGVGAPTMSLPLRIHHPLADNTASKQAQVPRPTLQNPQIPLNGNPEQDRIDPVKYRTYRVSSRDRISITGEVREDTKTRDAQ